MQSAWYASFCNMMSSTFSNCTAMTIFRKKPYLLVILSGLAWSPLSEAVDSGSQLRRFQDETQRRLQADRPIEALPGDPSVTPSQAAAKASNTQAFVAGFEVYGVTRFSDSEIANVLAPYTGRVLSTADIHVVANTLMRHYRNAGYMLAKVYVPPQHFNQVVRLDVEEGRLEPGGIEVLNKSECVGTKVVQDLLEHHLYDDRPLQRKDLERALLLADDLPGTRVGSVIYPGMEVGTARLRTVITEEPLLAGNIDFDNFNNRALGQERLGTTLYLNSPSGVGDQVVARFVSSGSRSNFAYMTYLRPVGSSGLRIGASLDYFGYDADALSGPMQFSGQARDFRLYVTYPLIRSRYTNLNIRTDISHARLVDHSRNDPDYSPPSVSPFATSERQINLFQVALSGDETHDFLPNGTTLYEATLAAGSLDVGGNNAHRAFDAAGPKTAGGFGRFHFSLRRLQHLTGPWSFYGSLDGQLASRNLDASQRYYLGGATAQAGYPIGESNGDQGGQVHFELRRDFVPAWGGNLQAGLFYSQGWVQRFKTPWQPINNHESLKSIGVQLTQSIDSSWVVRGLIGWQLGGDTSAERQTGENIDGRNQNYRAWVQVIRYFGTGAVK